MLPPPELLPAVLPSDRLGVKGVARPDLRARYRKIPNARNAVTVVSALLQSVGVVVAAGVIHTWWAYLIAFLVMGRGHCQLNILGHESAHRLLFSRKWWNDQVGRWLIRDHRGVAADVREHDRDDALLSTLGWLLWSV